MSAPQKAMHGENKKSKLAAVVSKWQKIHNDNSGELIAKFLEEAIQIHLDFHHYCHLPTYIPSQPT